MKRTLAIVLALTGLFSCGSIIIRDRSSGVTVRNTTSNPDNTIDANLDCLAPADVQSGDELLCICAIRDTNAVQGTASLTGWTLITSLTGANNIAVHALSKDSVDGTEDSTTISFTITAGTPGKSVCSSYAITGGSGTFETTGGQNGTGSSATIPAISSPGSGTIAIRMCGMDGNLGGGETCSSGCSTAQFADETSAGTKVEAIGGYESLSGSDSGGAASWTNSNPYKCFSLEAE